MIVGGFLILALNLYCMIDSIKSNKIKFACLSASAAGLTAGILIMLIK